MSLTTLTLSGKDLSTIGVIVDRIRGLDDSVMAHHEFVSLPRRKEFLRVTGEPLYNPREIRINGAIEGTSHANARARMREFKYRMRRGRLSLVFSDASTEIRYGFMGEDGVEVTPIGPALATRRYEFSAHVICPDGRVYENATTSVTSTTTAAVALPSGTVPVSPIVSITIGASAFNLIYKSSTGVSSTGERARFGLDGTQGGSGPYQIDMGKQTVLSSSGLSVIGALSTGTDFFDIDPVEDGDWTSSGWPTLQMSAGSSMTVTYQKGYD